MVPEASEWTKCIQRSIFSSIVIVTSCFGAAWPGLLNTLMSMAALVSEIIGVIASAPIRALAFATGSEPCANARDAVHRTAAATSTSRLLYLGGLVEWRQPI